MLAAFERPGRFYRGNLHCHSTLSDGELSPEAVCRFYRQNGYDFICLSDHFLARYGFPIADTIPLRTDGFTTILGAEIHAPAIANGEIWHILAVGLPADFAPTGADETGPALAARAHAAGAFVALPHPEWYALTPADAATIADFHAIEVFNADCDFECARGEGSALLDQVLGAGRKIGAIAVDDAHFYQDEAPAGWVHVKVEDNDPDALLAALKDGAYYASQGPKIERITREGDTLAFETSAVRSIHLLGPGAKQVGVRGVAITRGRLPLAKFAGAWCRAVIVDEAGRKAWTNPLWLD
ncbi:CehA/McbA family metallohydrolase [Acuticoccus sp. MNP-M23]|uniref:PHP domain-containing protein n=1 Tax=Acuticoccus sp. MNP-M23 TaxID=3072793 RepID=UPI00281568B0|nr:CehA/McbA family metallohydrolase [Acuticoccus sp. MNP-M23]WMS43340.1 CehA/McbA family metallohydrolase [Acuticoccus sp. MNP-M23]